MKQHIITDDQFGFRSKLSTSDTIILFVYNQYQCLHNKKFVISVFLDFSKVFVTAKHDILLNELHIYRMRSIILNWFLTYLKNRKLYVFIDELCSSFFDLEIGIPQGSVPGPLLSLIYINGMIWFIVLTIQQCFLQGMRLLLCLIVLMMIYNLFAFDPHSTLTSAHSWLLGLNLYERACFYVIVE